MWLSIATIPLSCSFIRSHLHLYKPRKNLVRCDVANAASSESHNTVDLSERYELWENNLCLATKAYYASSRHQQPISERLQKPQWRNFVESLSQAKSTRMASPSFDPLWELVKEEAQQSLSVEPEAGPQLYQFILSQRSIFEAVIVITAHEIESELIPATALKNLFLEMLTPEDEVSIHLDILAAAARSNSIGSVLGATLFHRGLHALVCYRVGHRLWLAGRRELAHYMQSTVSRYFSADIHPAARMGAGLYLNCGSGVVIGETAVVGDDVSILQGVTLGGTGKESGDRHPKVGSGVVLHDGATVLGNIKVEDGAVITSKSIVTKPVPPLAIVSGVPARVQSYRELDPNAFSDSLEQHLAFKYLEKWQAESKQ